MNMEFLKGSAWLAVTALQLAVFAWAWRTDRRRAAKITELEAFKERYRCEMINLYRWFASDECALMVLDWLDRQMVGGELRPDDGVRHDVASHGLQAVRQAVRDSHFNERCRGATDASCAMPVPEQPSISQSQIADLRDACSEGVHPDLFMALCVNEMLRGRTLKVITERREHLNPLDGVSAPVVRQIVNDLGERVWPRDENVYATEPDGRMGEARHVEVVYQLVKPTVDEKVDEILKLMRQFGTGANDLVNVNMTGGASPELAAKVARDCLTLKARPLEQAIDAALAEHRRLPSGWAVVGKSEEPGDVPRYLGPLEGWMDDPRRAVLFGNKEAAISAAATLNMVCPRDVDVVWMVYSHHLGNYVEQAQ